MKLKHIVSAFFACLTIAAFSTEGTFATVDCDGGGGGPADKPCYDPDITGYASDLIGYPQGYLSSCTNLGGNPTVYRCNIQLNNRNEFCQGDNPSLTQVSMSASGDNINTVDLTSADCTNLGGNPALYECDMAIANEAEVCAP